MPRIGAEDAAKLVSDLLTEALWTDLAKASRSPARLNQSALNAVSLWRWLDPYLVQVVAELDAESVDEDAAAWAMPSGILAAVVAGEEKVPVSLAVANVVYEIASGFALRAYNWSSEEETPMPLRANIEWMVRLAGVEEWAEGLGFPLALSEPPLPMEGYGRPDDAADYVPPREDIATAARVFHDVLSTYEVIDAYYREHNEALKQTELRRLVGQLVSRSRRWGGWMVNYLDPPLANAVPAMQYAALGCYAAAWSDGFPGAMSPTVEFLADYLRPCGVRAWLSEHDYAGPDWLP